jgi:hypothetical protein
VSIDSDQMRFISRDMALRLTTGMPLSNIARETGTILDRSASSFQATDEPVPEDSDAREREFGNKPIPYWRDAVLHVAITLELCSHDGKERIVAALTKSNPHARGSAGERDERFCWPRDSCCTPAALKGLSATAVITGFLRYLVSRPRARSGPTSRRFVPRFARRDDARY